MVPIAAIRRKLMDGSISHNELDELKKDQRKGVQELLKRYQAQQEKQQTLIQMHKQMWRYEQELKQRGYVAVCGVDEVGRGPLAGPVTACACILPDGFQLLGLTDSKKLSKAKREEYAKMISEQAVAYSIASVSAAEIDEINILQATKKAMTKAINGLSQKADHLLLDAVRLDVPIAQTSLIKGDAKSLSIAASSVLAKVWRDRYMEELAQTYPGYGFDTHAGYGTASHLQALRTYGMTPEHRKSFRPVLEESQGLVYGT
ncbi:ribonuclease HII [Shouchella clausii]|uniref:ribonuclease HII n=1 Tax=Shouchella clausii TaxID=79880 RepID=UPI00280A56DB|nr:ribonuclease HII [Shouchella clausii]WMM31612.1 ribonuclease HII [Shouchella clausii]